MIKAVLQYRASPGFRAAIERSRGEITVAIVDEDDDQAFAREIADAQVLLHVLKPVTAAMMDLAPRLRLIQKIGVGVNTIDIAAAQARGIAVANMPGTNTQSVAEMTLALMLGVLRRTSCFDPLTRRGQGWHPDPATLDGCGEIGGRTVGFLGFGAVARRLAPVIEALGGKVVYCATAPKPELPWQAVDLPTLLRVSDILSLHAPLTPATSQIIDRAAIAAMKPGAILINTARGGLVDEEALIEALSSGHLGGAGLDVFAQEPTAPDNPLFGLDTVVLMPHLAWLTPETLQRSLDVAFGNCRALRDGTDLAHRVA